MEYRIKEINGELTPYKRVYVQKKKKKLFGGYKWVYVKELFLLDSSHSTMINKEFKSVEKAKNWIDKQTEEYKIKYHTV